VRREVVMALSRLGDLRATEPLRSLLSDPDAVVQRLVGEDLDRLLSA
jgi:HEAT repeat protein